MRLLKEPLAGPWSRIKQLIDNNGDAAHDRDLLSLSAKTRPCNSDLDTSHTTPSILTRH
jgi:hypothetical protein